MNGEMKLVLGKKIDTVGEIEADSTSACLRKFIRVRVSIDTIKPLKRGIMIKI